MLCYVPLVFGLTHYAAAFKEPINDGSAGSGNGELTVAGESTLTALGWLYVAKVAFEGWKFVLMLYCATVMVPRNLRAEQIATLGALAAPLNDAATVGAARIEKW